MTGTIRLACGSCDREDFDGINEIPSDWIDVLEVQSLKESRRQVDFDDRTRSVLEWYTHLGTCPDCQREELTDDSSEPREVHPIVSQIINRDCHVGLSNREVIRHVISRLRDGWRTYRALPHPDRRLLMQQCIQQHRENRELYITVMYPNYRHVSEEG